MVSGFICGTSSLRHEDEDEYERQTRSAGSSPRRCRSSSKSNKNPYSTRGLDKFSALLIELEEKKLRILSQVDPDALVRFVYSDDRDFKPIVVKSKQKAAKLEEPKSKAKNDHPRTLTKFPSSSSMVVVKKENNTTENTCKEKKLKLYKKLRFGRWSEPKFYLPIIVIMILVVLVLFGRSFAIMCTSIGWYVIPTITDNNNNNGANSSNLKTSIKKKNYATIRRLSQKNLMTTEGTTSFKSCETRSQQQNEPRKSI